MENITGQHKKYSLGSQFGNTKDDKYLKSASKLITTMTDSKLKAMKSKENSDKFNTSMIEYDLMKPIDQSLRSNRETSKVTCWAHGN